MDRTTAIPRPPMRPMAGAGPGKLPNCALRPKPPRNALTLLDLAVSLLILSILVAAASLRYAEALLQYRVEAAAQRIAADLRLAQQEAKLKSTTQKVRFQAPSANSYTLVDLADPDRRGTEYTVDLGAEPFEVVISSAVFGSDASLAFNGFGIPDDGGSVVVQAGTYQKTVSVDAATGKAFVQ